MIGMPNLWAVNCLDASFDCIDVCPSPAPGAKQNATLLRLIIRHARTDADSFVKLKKKMRLRHQL